MRTRKWPGAGEEARCPRGTHGSLDLLLGHNNAGTASSLKLGDIELGVCSPLLEVIDGSRDLLGGGELSGSDVGSDKEPPVGLGLGKVGAQVVEKISHGLVAALLDNTSGGQNRQGALEQIRIALKELHGSLETRPNDGLPVSGFHGWRRNSGHSEEGKFLARAPRSFFSETLVSHAPVVSSPVPAAIVSHHCALRPMR